MEENGKNKRADKGSIPLTIFLLILVVGVVVPHAIADWQAQSLPYEEGQNAKQAYKWYLENHNTSGYGQLEGPTCSLMAREWINEYREHHNLSRKEYLCAIWYNDMQGWFYY